MDCITPDLPEPQLSETFIRVSLGAVRAAIPLDADDTEETRAEKYQAAVELFHAQHPRNTDEAALATRYVISHFRSLHLSARAATAQLPDDKMTRINAAAATADRLASANRRAIKDAQKPALGPAARAAAPGRSTRGPTSPDSTIAPDNMGPFDDPTLGPLPPGADGWIRLVPGGRPIPHLSRFQPRDSHGEPIPFHRHDLMTRAQFRATHASPRDPALDAIAIAEEEQMIAAQAAEQAGVANASP